VGIGGIGRICHYFALQYMIMTYYMILNTFYCIEKYDEPSYCCSCGNVYVAGVLKEFQEYYKITNAQVGLMQTAFIVAYMLFSLAFGYVGDRFNRKITISIGIFGWSGVMLLSSFVGPNVSLILSLAIHLLSTVRSLQSTPKKSSLPAVHLACQTVSSVNALKMHKVQIS